MKFKLNRDGFVCELLYSLNPVYRINDKYGSVTLSDVLGELLIVGFNWIVSPLILIGYLFSNTQVQLKGQINYY